MMQYFRLQTVSQVALAAITLSVSGCRSPTDGRRPESQACPQSYEFGNFGCARVVAIVEGPARPWPASYRFEVRAVPVRAEGIGARAALEPGVGPILLQLTIWDRAGIGTNDTVSAWVVARMVEEPVPFIASAPMPTFAADSVLRVLRFTKVGAVPAVDSVRLILRRP